MTNGLRTLRGRRPIYAVEFEGRRHDTGDKLGFLKATVEFALKREDVARSVGIAPMFGIKQFSPLARRRSN